MCGMTGPQRRRKGIIAESLAKLLGNIEPQHCAPGRLLDVGCGSYDNRL